MFFKKTRDSAFLGANNGNKVTSQLGLINISIRIGGLYFLVKFFLILLVFAWWVYKKKDNQKEKKTAKAGSSFL